MDRLIQQLPVCQHAGQYVADAPLWTYQDFARTVHALSNWLRDRHVRSIALWFEDSACFACALLAAWEADIAVFLVPHLAHEHIQWGEGADIWLTDSKNFPSVSSKIYFFPEWLAEDEKQAVSANTTGVVEDISIHVTSPVYLKTSGSDGTPKVVGKTARQLLAEAQALAQVLPFVPYAAQAGNVQVIGSVNQQHMYGLSFRIMLPLWMGWTIERRQCVYPEDMLAASMRYEHAIWVTSPAILSRLELSDNPCSQTILRQKLLGIISAGSALSTQVADRLEMQTSQRPYEIYGSTETGVIAARMRQPLWQALPAVRVWQEADGALAVESPWTEGVWHSADIVNMQPSGFELLGRKDRIIKYEDKRVSLAQIEHDLCQHAWIADAYCGLHPQYRRVAVWAALNAEGIEVLRRDGRQAVCRNLRRHLAHSQDRVAWPRHWRFDVELPRNAQSKIRHEDFVSIWSHKVQHVPWQLTQHESSDAAEDMVFEGRVPLDLVYFAGHFPAFPLVPGAVELEWICRLARQFEWGQRTVQRVENLKFLQFVRPHDGLRAILQFDRKKGRLIFKLVRDEAICASGRIVFDGQPSSVLDGHLT